MARVVSPPLGELNTLRTPLTRGERLTLDFFLEHTSEEWEVYIQPRLNGLQPDFVLLNPKIGIAVFEVKDWQFGAFERWVEDSNPGPPVLMGKRGHQVFRLQHQNPFEKVLLYREVIYDLYCSSIDSSSGMDAITGGVIFPLAPDIEAGSVFKASLDYHGFGKDPHLSFSGRVALSSGDLKTVFPKAYHQTHSAQMSQTAANDLRVWLIEPEVVSESRKKLLLLDDKQKQIATTRTATGLRRVKGPAGSGKSLAIAARAAHLVGLDKDVLVVCSNILMPNYLADLAVQNNPRARARATWIHFHGWLYRLFCSAGYVAEWRVAWRDRDPVEATRTLAGRAQEMLLDAKRTMPEEVFLEFAPSYDAILVDEGQDFDPAWWSLLEMSLRANGEMLLAADATQDIYGTAHRWTEEAMKGAGFHGDWMHLAKCYRLPSPVIKVARDFAAQFLPHETADLPLPAQTELLDECVLRWVQSNDKSMATDAVHEFNRLQREHQVHPSDIAFLFSTKALGRKVVRELEELGIRTVDTFGVTHSESRRKKQSFYRGDGRVKATTLHSFKGWESKALILCIGSMSGTAKDWALVYTGLTRVKRGEEGSFLVVVTCEPKLADFGKSWPNT